MYDVAILGGGPGGYVCAIRASQLGLKVALIEDRELGGTCLNRGCIPTKALLHSAEVFDLARAAGEVGVIIPSVKIDMAKAATKKDRVTAKLRGGVNLLMKKNNIDVITGRGFLKSDRTIEVTSKTEEITEVEAKNLVIATGSLPQTPGFFKYDGINIVTSDEMLSSKALPESIAIVGAGVIGCEFATIMSSFGVKVTLIDVLPVILSGVDQDISSVVKAEFEKRKIDIKCDTKITEVKVEEGSVTLSTEAGENITVERVLLAMGRKPNSREIGLEEIGCELGSNGEILVDDKLETNVPGVYAIGDVTNKMQLAHVASAQGLVVAANLAKKHEIMEYHAIPSAVFTSPEVASVGIGEEQAVKENMSIKVGKFPFLACGKAASMNDTRGFAKIIADNNDCVIGAQIVGPHASDLIHEVALAITNKLSLEDITRTIHTHPTLSESVSEAAENALGLSINI